MTGGKYLAEQRGAFERSAAPEPVTPAATAPLFEFAAMHEAETRHFDPERTEALIRAMQNLYE